MSEPLTEQACEACGDMIAWDSSPHPRCIPKCGGVIGNPEALLKRAAEALEPFSDPAFDGYAFGKEPWELAREVRAAILARLGD